jgi:hypothetical protein
MRSGRGVGTVNRPAENMPSSLVYVEGVMGGGMHRNSEPLRANLVSVTMPNGALGYLQKVIVLV